MSTFFNNSVKEGDTLQVMPPMGKFVVNSDPSKAKPKFSGAYYWIILTNKIPRGKAKAPNIVIPKKTISKEEIIDEDSIIEEEEYVEDLTDVLPEEKLYDDEYIDYDNLEQ